MRRAQNTVKRGGFWRHAVVGGRGGGPSLLRRGEKRLRQGHGQGAPGRIMRLTPDSRAPAKADPSARAGVVVVVVVVVVAVFVVLVVLDGSPDFGAPRSFGGTRIRRHRKQTGDVSEQPAALVLPESAGRANNNRQIGDVSMLDDGSESEQEIHPINTKLLQDVLRHFRQQIRNLDPSGSPSEKWRHLVQGFDITDMRLRFAHSNVSHTFRQPPHNGDKLTELVDSFLRGDERPENMPPMTAGLN